MEKKPSYFAKYIPIEGEIKKGDKYIDNLVRMSLPDFAPITYSGVKYEEDKLNGKYKNPILQSIERTTTPLNQAQKVKLFLCSRDVQIGDKNIHTGIMQEEDGKEYEEIVKEVKYSHQLDFMKGVSEANYSEIYKVIGEISPEATWVKENDEFDKEEVSFCYTNTMFPDEEVEYTNASEFLANEYYYKNREKFTLSIRIKCSQCNTFH